LIHDIGSSFAQERDLKAVETALEFSQSSGSPLSVPLVCGTRPAW
jgi:hypothetical protein